MGSTSPTQCPAGTFGRENRSSSWVCNGFCPPGNYCERGTVEPQECPAGTIRKDFGAINSSDCNDCMENWDSAPSRVVCIPKKCPAGQYSANGRHPTCSLCPAGTVSDVEGSHNCTLCPADEYQSEKGMTECMPCAWQLFPQGRGAVSCAAFNTPTLAWFILVGLLPFWFTLDALRRVCIKRYREVTTGAVGQQVRAALLAVEYEDMVEAGTLTNRTVARTVRSLRLIMMCAMTLAVLLLIPWVPSVFDLVEFTPYARARVDATCPKRVRPLLVSQLRAATANIRRIFRFHLAFLLWACIPIWHPPATVTAPVLTCGGAAMYNILAALGHLGTGDGWLYSSDDEFGKPALQYNAVALLAVWLNAAQCILTTLQLLMLQLAIHVIEPSAGAAGFAHWAARKLREQTSLPYTRVTARHIPSANADCPGINYDGDDNDDSPSAGQSSTRWWLSHKCLPAAIALALAACGAGVLAAPVVYMQSFYRSNSGADFTPIWDSTGGSWLAMMDAVLGMQLVASTALTSVITAACYRLESRLGLAQGSSSTGLLALVAADSLVEGPSKFAGSAASLVSGAPTEAARGIFELIAWDEGTIRASMARGTAAIIEEIELHGTATDLECLDYTLRQVAGSSDVIFQHGWTRDMTPSHRGKRLSDFMADPRSRGAGLLEAHVVAQRLYTTAAFRSINSPLRRLATHPLTNEVILPPKLVEPHPMPCTVSFLYDALKRMRAVAELANSEASMRRVANAQRSSAEDAERPSIAADADDTKQEERRAFEVLARLLGRMQRSCISRRRRKPEPRPGRVLWRGIKGVEAPERFVSRGGTELAPMSTTSDLRVAVRYARGVSKSLIFMLRVDNFMQEGADLAFLSAFPQEREFLYPPLTFLAPLKTHHLRHDGTQYTILEVVPHYPS